MECSKRLRTAGKEYGRGTVDGTERGFRRKEKRLHSFLRRGNVLGSRRFEDGSRAPQVFRVLGMD